MEKKHIINQRKVADKLVFRANKITRNRESHNIMKKESVPQEDTATLNIDAPNNRPANV